MTVGRRRTSLGTVAAPRCPAGNGQLTDLYTLMR
jgi:hypothetical protein